MRKLAVRHLTSMLCITSISALVMVPPSFADAQDKSRVITIKGTAWSGTLQNTGIDTNGDGENVFSFISEAKTKLGRVTLQGMIENQPPLPPSNDTCAVGAIEFNPDPVFHRTVIRFDKGDLLFVEVPRRTGCFDPSTLTFTFQEEGILTGGTGRFEQATGSIVTNLTGNGLVPAPDFFFGAFTGGFTIRFTHRR
jgi:hypothetical protein